MTSKAQNLGLLIIRIGLGTQFMVVHGFPKLFAGPEKWTQLGGAIGVFGIDFAPAFWGFMAAFAEGIGGLMLIIGLLTRPFSILLTITMTVAAAMHLNAGDAAGWPIEVGIVFLGLAFTGPGKYSLKNLIPACRNRWYL
jgi:putative oxidoreductase